MSQRRLDKFAADLSSEHAAAGVDVVPIQCNVADEDSVVNMVSGTVGKFGRIDYAVNAAGLAHVSRFSEFKTADVSYKQYEGTDHKLSIGPTSVLFITINQKLLLDAALSSLNDSS